MPPTYTKWGTRYPWKNWFGRTGRIVTIHHNKDYHCMPHSMVSNIRAAARNHKLKVAISLGDDLTTISFRVVKKEAS